MNKASEYSERIISRLKLDLENELILSITDMLKGEEDVNLDMLINRSTTFVSLKVYYEEDTEEDTIDTIEIYEEYYEQDGLIYSGTRELTELDIEELLAIWNELKERA